MAEAALAGIAADCEVYGLFSNLLPAALTGEGGELQTARARQGKVPDFRLLLPTPDGPKNCLAELKVISAGKTWYPRGTLGKGADRRADRLPAEYERTLRDLDADFSVHQLVQILVLWSQGSELLVVLRRASLWQGPGATCLQISTTC